MTLISCFPCAHGFAIHADSEENCGNFRRSVQKIIPQQMGQLEVIIAGSGIGQLIDGFAAKVKERLDRNGASGIETVKLVIENRLPDFYEKDVKNFPASDEYKLNKFIIAAYSPGTKGYQVWASRGTTLMPITACELAGVEDVLYYHVADRFYRPSMSFSQAALAGLYLFTIAEKTSSFIRSPIQVAVISENGISMEKKEYIEAMQEHLAAYEDGVNQVFLACADTSIPVHELEGLLSEFAANAVRLHREHIDGMMDTLNWKDVLKSGPVPKHPIGVPIGFDSRMRMTVQHDPVKAEQETKDFKKSIELGESLQRQLKPEKSKDQQ